MTTGVLDLVGRADQDPIGAPSWSGPTRPAVGQLKVVANQLAASSIVGGTAHSYWSQTQFPSVQEGWATVAVLPAAAGGVSVTLKSQVPNTAGWDAYQWTYTVGTGWRMFYIVDNGYSQIGSTVASPLMSVGDSIGFQSAGTTHRGLYLPAAALSWSEITVGSNNDPALLGLPGFIGVEMTDVTVRVSAFGGGASILSAPLIQPRRMRSRRTSW
jgi:hypothetical protein